MTSSRKPSLVRKGKLHFSLLLRYLGTMPGIDFLFPDSRVTGTLCYGVGVGDVQVTLAQPWFRGPKRWKELSPEHWLVPPVLLAPLWGPASLSVHRHLREQGLGLLQACERSLRTLDLILLVCLPSSFGPSRRCSPVLIGIPAWSGGHMETEDHCPEGEVQRQGEVQDERLWAQLGAAHAAWLHHASSIKQVGACQ